MKSRTRVIGSAAPDAERGPRVRPPAPARRLLRSMRFEGAAKSLAEVAKSARSSAEFSRS